MNDDIATSCGGGDSSGVAESSIALLRHVLGQARAVTMENAENDRSTKRTKQTKQNRKMPSSSNGITGIQLITSSRAKHMPLNTVSGWEAALT